MKQHGDLSIPVDPGEMIPLVGSIARVNTIDDWLWQQAKLTRNQRQRMALCAESARLYAQATVLCGVPPSHALEAGEQRALRRMRDFCSYELDRMELEKEYRDGHAA